MSSIKTESNMTKHNRSLLSANIDPRLIKGLKLLALEKGTSKYGEFVEEAIQYLRDKYGYVLDEYKSTKQRKKEKE